MSADEASASVEADGSDASSSFDPADERRRAAEPELPAHAAAASDAAARHAKASQLAMLLDKATAYSQFLGGQLTADTYRVVARARRGEAADAAAVAVPALRASQPALVTGGTLRAYQMTAVNWLISLFENGVNGILADEMGLGKTIVTVAFFAHLWEKGMRGPFLVVAPLSTLANWQNEFRKFAPELPTLLYHGSIAERSEMRSAFYAMKYGAGAVPDSVHAEAGNGNGDDSDDGANDGGGGGGGDDDDDDDDDGDEYVGETVAAKRKAADKAKAKQSKRSKKKTKAEAADSIEVPLPVVITSYDIAMRDRFFLEQHEWRFLVVDEAHRLKSFSCKLLRELKQIPSLNRLLLTGTPLQNNLSELWSLLNYILPDIFDSLDNFLSWFDFEDDLAGDDDDDDDDDEPANGKAKASDEANTATAGKKRGRGASSSAAAQAKQSRSAVASAVNIAKSAPLRSKSQLVQKLHNVLRPFFLRRLKSEVLKDLPTKREVVLYAGMTDVQRAYYNAIKTRDMDALTATSDPTKTVRKPSLMNLMMQMRKVCNHPVLFDDNFDNFYKNYFASDEERAAQLSQREREELEPQKRLRSRRADVDYSGPNDAQFNALLLEFDRREELEMRKKRVQKAQRAGRKVDPSELADLLALEEEVDTEADAKDDDAKLSAAERKVVRARSAFMFFVKAKRAQVHEQLQKERAEHADDASDDDSNGDAPRKRRRRAASDASDNNGKAKSNGDTHDDDEGDDDDEDDEQSTNKVSMGALMRALAAQWRALSDDERKPFEDEAAADKQRYADEKAAIVREQDPSAFIDDADSYLTVLRRSSGKFQLLDKMLPRLLREGHKVLIFSQMTRMLDILEDYLQLNRFSCVRIDGSTKQSERQEFIEQFNSDPSVSIFLLSTRAGGLGINLTAADTVIIYDSDWNPQGDLQAQDRAHRYGQKRAVAVYRLITSRSCESRLLRRATEKLKLESLVIKKGSFERRSQVKLSDNDLNEILELEMGDANVGKEKPISDAELDKLLDRTWLVEKFDEEMARKRDTADDGFELLEPIVAEKY